MDSLFLFVLLIALIALLVAIIACCIQPNKSKNRCCGKNLERRLDLIEGNLRALNRSVPTLGLNDVWEVTTSPIFAVCPAPNMRGTTFINAGGSAGVWVMPSNCPNVIAVVSIDAGQTWTPSTITSGDASQVFGISPFIAYSKHLTITIALFPGTHIVGISNDNGMTWSIQAQTGISNVVGNIIWVPRLGLFVAGSTTPDKSIQVSANGIHWEEVSAPGTSIYVLDTGKELICVGSSGAKRSKDAKHWVTHLEMPGMGFAVYSPTLDMIVCCPMIASQDLTVSKDGGITWVTYANLLPEAVVFTCGLWLKRYETFCFMRLGVMVPEFYMWQGSKDKTTMRFGTITIEDYHITNLAQQVAAMGYTPSLDEFWFCGAGPNDPAGFSDISMAPLH